jgi:hypothetical protein
MSVFLTGAERLGELGRLGGLDWQGRLTGRVEAQPRGRFRLEFAPCPVEPGPGSIILGSILVRNGCWGLKGVSIVFCGAFCGAVAWTGCSGRGRSGLQQSVRTAFAEHLLQRIGEFSGLFVLCLFGSLSVFAGRFGFVVQLQVRKTCRTHHGLPPDILVGKFAAPAAKCCTYAKSIVGFEF